MQVDSVSKPNGVTSGASPSSKLKVLSAVPDELTARFSVTEPFAQGATGSLYMAQDAESGQQGILKVLHVRTGTTEAELQRLKRELAKQATLTNAHLSVPTLTGEAGNHVWIFRPWIEGVSLRQRLENGGALAMPEAVAIAAQVAAGLDELHRAGLLHRDLSPRHILLTQHDGGIPHVTLIDAGLAARVDTDGPFDIVGTPSYVSPEQATGKLVSFRSDLYALGCVMSEMVTGQVAFGGLDAASILEAQSSQKAPEPPSSLPDDLRSLMTSLLAKEPRERPFSAQQVRKALDGLGILVIAPTGRSLQEDNVTGNKPKATLMGIAALRPPAPPEPSAPPPPPAQSKPPAPPSPSVPAPQVKAKKSPDNTQEIDALDLDAMTIPGSEKASSAGSTSPGAAPSIPPPVPGSIPGSIPAPAVAAPVVEEPLAPAVQMPSPSAADVPAKATQPLGAISVDLDYDDLAETRAFDKEEAAERLDAEMRAAQAPDPLADAFTDFSDPKQEMAFAPTLTQPATTLPASQAPDAGPFPQAAGSLPPTSQVSVSQPPMSQPPVSQPPVSQPPVSQPPVSQPTGPMTPVSSSGVLSSPGVMAASVPGVMPGVSEDTDDLPVQKKSRTGIWALLAVTTFCLLPLGAAGAGYLFLQDTVNGWLGMGGAEELARSLEADTNPVNFEQPTQPGAFQPSPVVPAQAGSEGTTEENPTVAPEPVEASPVPANQRDQARDERSEERDRARAERADAREVQEEPAGSPFEQIRATAREHYQARQYAQAAQAYERAVAMNPNHAGSFAGLGAARQRMGDSRGAAAAYERAVALAPSNSGFFSAMARAYETGGNRSRALAAYQHALRLNANNRAAQEGIARLGG